MNLLEVKQTLKTATAVNFKLPNGSYVKQHFHITEVGLVTKHFIDCGGIERKETVVNFQLWNANDTEHRLKPQKLLHIIELSQKRLGIGNYEVEVEYQTETIGRYNIHYNGKDFLLTPKQTACLAAEACGIPAYSSATTQVSCTPGGGCC